MSKETYNDILDLPFGFPMSFQEVRELHMLYTCAMREICAKLENLNQGSELKQARNSIQHIKNRIKSPENIRNKMNRKGLMPDYEIMRKEILDIAGVRVTCSYIEDIYAIANMLIWQDNVTLIREKDYIASPKPNGYRSFHLTVTVPVYFSNEKQMVPVEIQMGTLAMDFWVCLEHQLRYKPSKEVLNIVRSQLISLAGKMFDADVEMQQIYQKISGFY